MILVSIPTFSWQGTDFCHYRYYPGSHIASKRVCYFPDSGRGFESPLRRIFRLCITGHFSGVAIVHCKDNTITNTFVKFHLDSIKFNGSIHISIQSN